MSMAMTSTVAFAMSVTFSMPATAVPAFMTAVVVPVVTIFFFMAISDKYLVSAATITSIPYSVITIIAPWVWAVNYHFVSMINIIITVSYR